MTRYIEFPLEGGGSVVIEVDGEAGAEGAPMRGSVAKAARPVGELVQAAGQSFDQAVEAVQGAANLLIQKLRSLHEAPDEIEITFGLKASGELGSLVVAKAGVEANYTVTLKWKQPDSSGKAR